MIYYDKIDVSEGIDVNKTSKSKECNVSYSWYIKSADYCCIISRFTKNEAINVMQNIDFTAKREKHKKL